MSDPKCIWYTPEEKGGIQTYTEGLLPWIIAEGGKAGISAIQLTSAPLRGEADVGKIVRRLRALNPEILHIQHEFGLFGKKIPPFYRFPALVRILRRELPKTRLLATAHTVLGADYQMPWRARGVQAPVRWLLNQTAHRWLRDIWTRQTWGGLDGVVVHSQLQKGTVENSGCKRVRVIPHYVPNLPVLAGHPSPKDFPELLVFGYFSPEKGQDLAIRALAKLKLPATLLLAGGVRREEDRAYLNRCLKLAEELGVRDRIRVTGFVPSERIDDTYRGVALAIAPFRETSGSGSLAQAFARGVPTLASDLPLNRELNDRVPGCLALFKSEDPADCARAIDELVGDSEARFRLAAGSRRYAEFCAPERIAREHIEFYQKFC